MACSQTRAALSSPGEARRAQAAEARSRGRAASERRLAAATPMRRVARRAARCACQLCRGGLGRRAAAGSGREGGQHAAAKLSCWPCVLACTRKAHVPVSTQAATKRHCSPRWPGHLSGRGSWPGQGGLSRPVRINFRIRLPPLPGAACGALRVLAERRGRAAAGRGGAGRGGGARAGQVGRRRCRRAAAARPGLHRPGGPSRGVCCCFATSARSSRADFCASAAEAAAA